MNNERSTNKISVRESKRRVRLSFAVFAAFFVLVIVGVVLLQRSELDRNLQWPLRRILDWNAELASKYLDSNRVDKIAFRTDVTPAHLKGKQARTNGRAGLETAINIDEWRVKVVKQNTAAPNGPALVYDLSAIRAFPKRELTVEFKCIEGWSEIMSFGGTRFLDFVNQFGLATKSGSPVTPETSADDLYRYVGLETPDGEYFVSIDMKSALNPQTLLAYEQNGVPLTDDHGAPLRLYIPNKYGVKSLKRIGTITFTDVRPRDYWEEDGYDHFIGL